MSTDKPTTSVAGSCLRCEALVGEFFDGGVRFLEVREPHPAEDVFRLRELDFLVGDHLHAIAPWVRELKSPSREPLDVERESGSSRPWGTRETRCDEFNRGRAVVLLSGGMDIATAAAQALD